mmetsp:Transcript_26611/g.91834  ORF Transcript_26611/g.91834 Transcript_26611/m.91834 type:complete len:427 (-) Transcript_26611:13-1293(-)
MVHRRGLVLCLALASGLQATRPAGPRGARPPSSLRSGEAYLECDGAADDVAEWFARARRENKALLARRAVPRHHFEGGVDAAAVLALSRTAVRSRVVVGDGKKLVKSPFAATLLDAPVGWTLLVNDAELHLPAVARLRDAVSETVLGEKTSRWRRDDVMVSVASDGGGVGPHVDTSEVVLLQAAGTRRWAIETAPVSRDDAEARLDPTKGTRCLVDFKPDASWVLEPGDFIYIPARVPHDGVAIFDSSVEGDAAQLCVTVSLGFREYSANDLAARWADDAALDDDFGTAGMKLVDLGGVGDDSPAEISRETREAAKAAIRASLEARLSDDVVLAKLLGEVVTEPRDASALEDLLESLDDASVVDEPRRALKLVFSGKATLHHAVGARFAHALARSHDGDEVVVLCANGSCHEAAPRLQGLARLVST